YYMLFLFTATATTEIYTLSLHDALPIYPEHEWNVPKMLKSVRKSLEYCIANFGPYAHKQARIIEFPRVARFAQAFPGTMPYSERSEEHTSELQSRRDLVCRLLLEKKKQK